MTGMTRTERYINRAVKAKRQEEKIRKKKESGRKCMCVCHEMCLIERVRSSSSSGEITRHSQASQEM